MKKKTKFSLGMKIVTLLTVITMASVGFASWVITAPVTAAQADGSIKVENVVDNGAPIFVTANIVSDKDETIVIDADDTTSENYKKYSSFVFGYADFDEYDIDTDNHGWLSTPVIGKENLTVFLKVTVKNNRDAAATKGVTVTFKTSDPATFETGITNNAYFAPTITGVGLPGEGLTEVSYNSGADNIVFTIPAGKIPANKAADAYEVVLAITFKWGVAFDEINPYIYYNMNEHTQVRANDAVDKLTKLYTATNGVSYTVVVDQEK